MSVIGNALKAAQKEKQRRAGSGGPPPLIVPLRGGSKSSGFSWKRALALGIGGAAVFGATAVGVNLMKRDSRIAPPPAPTILGEAPMTVDSAKPPLDPAARVATSTPPRAKSPTTPARTTKRAQTAPAASAARGVAAPVAPTQQGARDSAPGLRIAVDAPREDAARLFAAAVAAHRAGDLSYARIAYERVLTMAPSDVDAMNNLALVLLAQRELDRAERLLRRAVQLAPRKADVWANLGTVLRDRGQSADAIAAFQHALEIDPLHESARVSLAQQYVAIGSFPKAREILQQVVAANPAAPEAQYTLGQVLEQQGDRDGAIRAYQAFVRVAPGRFATHVEIVRRRIRELAERAP